MAQIGETLQLKAGTDRTYRHLARRRNATTGVVEAYTDMTSGATVEAKVWPGDDRAPILTIAGDATDAATGYFAVTFAADDTASVAEGLYRYQVLATEGGTTVTVFDGRIRISGIPGTATAPTTYCSFEDMKRLAPWIEDLADADEDQAGFAEQRGEARKWLDVLAQKHYRVPGIGNRQTSLDHLLGYGDTVGDRDATLQGWLDDDRLILDDDVVRACAHYAIAEVCTGKLTPGTVGSGAGYSQFAAYHRAQARGKASTLALRLDTTETPDGECDVVIRLGTTNTWYC